MNLNITRTVVLLGFFSVFFCTASFGQQSSNFPSQVDIGNALREVIGGTGPITREEYDHFWNRVTLKGTVGKKQVIDFFSDIMVDMLAYQNEIWRCAFIAWNTRTIVDCLEAREIYERIKATEAKHGGEINQMDVSQENTRRLIIASANHGILKFVDGREFEISAKIIAQTKSGLKEKVDRLKQILRVKY